MLIKICGLTTIDEVNYINKEHIDFAGFVLFFPKSKRNISPSDAKRLLSQLDKTICSVAVVVSPTIEQVMEIENIGFDYIQIHGQIPDFFENISKLKVLKAFNVSDLNQLSNFEAKDFIKGYVFDALEPGSGKTFDWSLVSNIPETEKLLLLAGGLNPSNVKEAICFVKPDGVDVSSGVEYDSGLLKDPNKVMDFVNAVRSLSE